jgi:hypothetical protein
VFPAQAAAEHLALQARAAVGHLGLPVLAALPAGQQAFPGVREAVAAESLGPGWTQAKEPIQRQVLRRQPGFCAGASEWNATFLLLLRVEKGPDRQEATRSSATGRDSLSIAA